MTSRAVSLSVFLYAASFFCLALATSAMADNQGDTTAGSATDQGQTSTGASVESQPKQSENSGGALQEVIVTAQKREERLQDVPVPVAVVSADWLSTNELPRLQDFYSTVPGLNMSPPAGGSTSQNIAIRGVTSGAGGGPTVAVTIDDVPFGFSTGLDGNIIPDVDPADLSQIEVLRGPQGALYGASGLGGLIKYVTVDPSSSQLSGRIQADALDIQNGNGLGYSVRGGANIPITDSFAVRASAYTRVTPGYIDNPILDVRGVNRETSDGGYLAAMWSPSGDFSLKLTALVQRDAGNGAEEVFLPTAGQPQSYGYGDLQQNYIGPAGGYEKKIQAYIATMKAKVGIVDLTSVTGYNDTHFIATIDETSGGLGALAQAIYGVSGAVFLADGKISNFSQEFRASIPFGDRFDWLLGGFFTHQVDQHNYGIPAVNTDTGAYVGNFLSNSYKAGEGLKYQELAGFTDLTVRFTDSFDIQFGGRESKMTNSGDTAYDSGFFEGNTTIVVPPFNSSSTAFTYLVTPRLKVTPDLMTYVRLASGYRPGGKADASEPTGTCLQDHFPCEYAPDKTYNYEIGAKGAAYNGRLSYDASIYYIDWKDMQFRGTAKPLGLGYNTNGGGAKSEGVELSINAKPLSGLLLAGWVTYGKAVLTENFPVTSTYYGVSGDRLPFSSRFSGNISATQDFPISGSLTGFAGITAMYQGNTVGNFDVGPDRVIYSPYARIDLRGGFRIGEPWLINLYANNVADRRAVIGGGGAYNFPSYAYVVIQPRTIGISVRYSFEGASKSRQ